MDRDLLGRPPTRRRRIDWLAKVAKGQTTCQSHGSASSACLDRRDLSLPVRNEDLTHLAASQARLPLPSPKVALASCTRGCCPARLREWLFWHLAKGIRLFLLRWEGAMTPEQEEVIRDLRDRGRLILLESSLQGKTSSSFQRVMTRQIKFVHHAIRAARARRCDFLLHLDDDELLFSETDSIPALLRRFLGSSKRCVHFENLEAVFPFEMQTDRPFSRQRTRFRKNFQVLYCNGKSAANLTAGEVYASGVHHFCRHDRSFEEADPKFGLHDETAGCSHPACCIQERSAFVLHFDSPSFVEWRDKFALRAQASMSQLDEEELQQFPFKRASVEAFTKVKKVPRQKQIYRHWRCLPGRKEEEFHPRITGSSLEAAFQRLLSQVRVEFA
ncbi:avt5 [Symbiodinium natans]|uniref:Avt5 protein n=1 Tax=Symbiodinium natans TaxID=878477 RepID=A0A812KGJ7_9DINO|nr:avt5 [Symbiodinium natans]